MTGEERNCPLEVKNLARAAQAVNDQNQGAKNPVQAAQNRKSHQNRLNPLSLKNRGNKVSEDANSKTIAVKS